ncbi:TetR/AcrR family transcriptional regulator [Aeromicrobium sp. YIM 150415]|uniref:TetR/AcrR family transcriptional regulator n=1 Tax=Aeromicrobium sp. YIM 150415 TaxID=2803912 RepID=UPI001962DF55|nr:TetR family transcriptional regulator [Aeromicrobium sp. YIM 150415]MBM9465442.1 TetR/AcrR family transcriptional regulator [Aeromicrobium sp. YIM 150415]
MSTPTQDRTRHAILLAAIRVLGSNRRASMREIGEAAEVARSTVHRYFADRPALEAAVGSFVEEEYARTAEEARPQDGTGLEALMRLATELFDRLDILGWWFLMPEDEQVLDALEEDEIVGTIVDRGHADHSIDPALPGAWISDLLWSLLYSANAHTRFAVHTRGEVRSLFLHSLRKSVAAD